MQLVGLMYSSELLVLCWILDYGFVVFYSLSFMLCRVPFFFTKYPFVVVLDLEHGFLKMLGEFKQF